MINTYSSHNAKPDSRFAWSEAFLIEHGVSDASQASDIDYEYIWSPMFIRAIEGAEALAADLHSPAFDGGLKRLASMVAELNAHCPDVLSHPVTIGLAGALKLTVQLRGVPDLLRSLAADS